MGFCRSTALTISQTALGIVFFGLLADAPGHALAAGGLVQPLAPSAAGASEREGQPDTQSSTGSMPSEAATARPPIAIPDSALAFVQQRHLGESLGWLGYQVASRTVTFATIVGAVGRTKAQEVVQDELQYLQPQYQQEWDRNLAAAYAASFSDDELVALDAGNPPPDVANKFRNKQRDVGMDMKGRSSELLKVYVSTALDNALKKAKP